MIRHSCLIVILDSFRFFPLSLKYGVDLADKVSVMSQLQQTLSEAFQSTTVRVVVGLVALGAVPFYLLSLVSASLN